MFDDDPIVGNECQRHILQRVDRTYERKQLVDTADLVAVGTIVMRDTTRSNGTAVAFQRSERLINGQIGPTPVLIVTYVFRRASLIRNLARPRRRPTQVNRHVSHHAAGNHDVGSVIGRVLRDDFGDVHLGDVRPRLTRPADSLVSLFNNSSYRRHRKTSCSTLLNSPPRRCVIDRFGSSPPRSSSRR